MEVGFVLMAFGKDKSRMKVNLCSTYCNRDDSKKSGRLTPDELEKKAKIHAQYLLENNYYAYELLKITN